jgi:dihydrofolate reductase
MSVDGYIAGPNGEMDWMVWNWDDRLKNYVFELTEPVDTIILGRKMTDGFVSYWSDIMTKPDDPSYDFAKKMIIELRLMIRHGRFPKEQKRICL